MCELFYNVLNYRCMELRDFVSETLKAIIGGVKDAQLFAKENDSCINPNQYGALVTPKHVLDMGDGTISIVQPVSFDVCITYNKKKSGKGGIEVISGGIESTANTASRVKFSVAVSLPRMKPNCSTQNPDYGVSDCNETD